MYYRNSKAAICVYDVTKRQTFEQVESWVRPYRETAGEKTPILLVGNKIDLLNREVDTEMGKQYAQSHGYSFLEVSAKVGANIDLIIAELQAVAEPSKASGPEQDSKRSRCC
jgi:Ras-related protein Rab-2A